MLALVDADNMGSFAEENGHDAAAREIFKIGHQMSKLCLILSEFK